jgi:ribosomal protein L29
MKLTEFKDKIKQLSDADLKVKLEQLQRELFALRLNGLTAHVKDYSQFNKLRKNIARILTRMNQKIQENNNN